MNNRTYFFFFLLLFLNTIGFSEEMVTKSRFSAILVKDRSVADSLILKLNAGEDFSQLAKEFSVGPNGKEGGDLGYLASGDMEPVLDAAVVNLNVGEHTEPIMQNYGYFILKKTDEKEFAIPTDPFFSSTMLFALLGLLAFGISVFVVYHKLTSTAIPDSTLEEGVVHPDVEEIPDLPAALLAGMASAFLGAIIWAAITVATKYQIGYMAIGVGFLVGFSVQHWGNGKTMQFGLIGGFFALVGCFLGNFFSVCYFVSQESYMSFMEFLLSDASSEVLANIHEWTEPIDAVFYFIAASAGYSLAIRGSEEESEAASD
ncbi:MAG: peptidylprolyl isomerase [Calditrichia bacterium]